MRFKSKYLLIFTMLTVTMTSCGQTPINEENIAGVWKVTAYDADTKGLSPSLLKEAERLALSAIYEFRKDGTYSQDSSYQDVQGTWRIQDKSIFLKFSFEFEKNTKEEYKITAFNKKKMTWLLESSYGNTTIILTKKLTF